MRQQFQLTAPGTSAFKWLLGSRRELKFDFLLDPRFQWAMIYCLVAEERSEVIWNLLLSDEIPPSARDAHPTTATKWKDIVLRSMLEAQTFWIDSPLFLQPGVEGLLAAAAVHENACRTDELRLSYTGTGVWLDKLFHSGGGRYVQPAHYDKFPAELRDWVTDRANLDYSLAMLRLHHPTTPDPAPALAFFQNCGRHAGPASRMANVTQPQSWAQASNVYWTVVRVAQSLQARGQEQEALDLLERARQWIPGILHKSPRPTRLPQTAPEGKEHYHDRLWRPKGSDSQSNELSTGFIRYAKAAR